MSKSNKKKRRGGENRKTINTSKTKDMSQEDIPPPKNESPIVIQNEDHKNQEAKPGPFLVAFLLSGLINIDL